MSKSYDCGNARFWLSRDFAVLGAAFAFGLTVAAAAIGLAPTSAIDPSIRVFAQQTAPGAAEDGPCYYAGPSAHRTSQRFFCAE